MLSAKKNHTIEKITAMTLRKHLGEYLNRVHLKNEIIVVEKSGKVMAAMIPAARLGRIQSLLQSAKNLTMKKSKNNFVASTGKPSFSLRGSIEILTDLEEASQEVSKLFKESIAKTAKQL